MPSQHNNQLSPDIKQKMASMSSKFSAAIPHNPSSQKLMKANEYSEADFAAPFLVEGNNQKANNLAVGAKLAGAKGQNSIIKNCSNDSSRANDLHLMTDSSDIKGESPNHISNRQWITVLILFFVNLINYMDRLTIAGILTKIQKDYQIGDAEGGALQTAFVASYMVFAPIFGYLGDRHSRRWIMAFGVLLWTAFTIIGSFMPNYMWFLICRAMVGVGEASYSTIAPTIISDMFVKDMRSKMLALFYFAIPVGSGLGYVIGAETTAAFDGDWRWGLRVTPILGIVAVGLITFVMKDPPRGESEGHGGNLKATTYSKDLKSLAANKSFVFSTIAFTCVAFCTGALSWWGPKYLETAVASMQTASGTDEGSINVSNISLIFGFVTMLSGIVGVPLGSILSTKLKAKYPRADPLICATGLLLSAGFLCAGMLTSNWNIHLTFFLLFLGEVALNLNWSIVADILLYVVVPTRRGTAEAVQILISHALGDAGSPYLIGVVSDALKGGLPKEYVCSPGAEDVMVPVDTVEGLENFANRTQCDLETDFTSMQYSLFINNFVEVIGGILFIVTAIYVIKDKLKVDRFIADAKSACDESSTSASSSNSNSSSEMKLFFSPKGENVSISTDDEDEEAPQLQLIISPNSNQLKTSSGLQNNSMA